MTDAVIQLQPDGSGKMVDNSSLTVGSNTAYRQRVQLAGSVAAGQLIEPLTTTPVGTEYAVPVRTVKGGLTASAPAVASVGVTSASALAANSSRRGAVFTNTSAYVISLGINNAAVLNSGITLNPGGVWVMDEYTVTNLGTGTIVSGTLGPGTPGTTLPANSTLLAFRIWTCNNATAASD